MQKSKQREFIKVAKTYKGEHTYIRDTRWWLEGSRKYKACETVDQLKSLMRKDKYFSERHIRKLDEAYRFYFANKDLYV